MTLGGKMKMSHRLRVQMTKIFFCEDGCPSQPINKEEKPNLFDELGGIPAPESDDWDDEDKNEKEISSDERRKKNFFEKFFQLQGFFPDDDDDI